MFASLPIHLPKRVNPTIKFVLSNSASPYTTTTKTSRVPTTPPPTMASSLPTKTAFLAALRPETCPICYEEFTKPIKTECNHSFCLECARTWFKNTNTCPSCRSVVYETNQPVQQSTSQPTSEDYIRQMLRICFSPRGAAEFGQVSLNCFLITLDARDRTTFTEEAGVRRVLETMHATGDEIRLHDNTIYDVLSRPGRFQYALRQYIDARRTQLSGISHLESLRSVIEGVNRHIRGVRFDYDEGVLQLEAASRLRVVQLWSEGRDTTITHILFGWPGWT